ncbi:cell division protein FtsZ [Candidatus Uhrbacteria bacterium RIFCSPHIGHO2_02_FULL_53_13]|uniref:Cell division protein FtsZ n=3 Tax=Candidatus Uhriibacteriota TaxID=1752732 RepID=A0A1F7TVA7_9BACT|nr:MAG: cell division protein FtsZ [Candidatus Uhrbacteria bacterium RIFCSPHIGHO2_02_FULL_53_13]OGL90016.1 MAG: cell division protein FtsZ [Candidatus Uhrbacteria bacterium RIFCSPLOWO2_02_FULL_53_10]
MAQVKPEIETFADIRVVGVGGAGNSAINRMIQEGIKGVDFIALNTDVQALHHSLAKTKLAIGKSVTRGLGAGMNPEIGYRAAEESQNEIRNLVNGADMVFITCGLGGGTGSGAAHHVAKLAHDVGALTVAVVTKPFAFEGAQRKRNADEAYEKLSQNVDTIITIPNDRVLQIIDKKTSLMEAFRIVDDVLRQGVQGISELITVPGLINVDFADVKAIMAQSGSALMGIGRSSGENRAVEAAKQAIASPLLEISIEGAKGILFTIAGSSDLGMHEVAEAAKVITGSADDDARVIFGANINDNMEDEVIITVVATGFDGHEQSSTVFGTSVVSAAGTWAPPVTRVRDHKDVRMREEKVEAVSSLKRVPNEPVSYTNTMASDGNGKDPRTLIAESETASHEDENTIDIPAFIRKKMM